MFMRCIIAKDARRIDLTEPIDDGEGEGGPDDDGGYKRLVLEENTLGGFAAVLFVDELKVAHDAVDDDGDGGHHEFFGIESAGKNGVEGKENAGRFDGVVVEGKDGVGKPGGVGEHASVDI